jgi:phosphopantetheinyl transferase (holo-ACP synthase)
MRTPESVEFYENCRSVLSELYGSQILSSVWSLKEAFSKKADKLVEPSSVNPLNLAQKAGQNPAAFEAAFYNKKFNVPLDRPIRGL